MRIGILGGGQLARMLIASSYRYGYTFKVLTGDINSSASKVTNEVFCGDFNDEQDVLKFSNDCDVITLENEFINYKILESLEKSGKKLYPSSNCIKLIQDKYFQKENLVKSGIPVADYIKVETENDILKFAEKYEYPVVLKTRTMGYDGKGNFLIKSESEIKTAVEELSKRGKLMCEQFINFEKEIAIQITRSVSGEIKIYPLVETIQKNHICHIVKYSEDLFEKEIEISAKKIAEKIVNDIDYTGTMGIEMFFRNNNELLVNELAPRVHNTGHYTIETSKTSQFENHNRAILGLPLGDVSMNTKSAVMINIIGERNGKAEIKGLDKLLKKENVYLHDYSKNEVKTGRKMGHITVLDNDLNSALNTANESLSEISI
ncbi:MAG TPA: 5-(carboxyamino)imidazole ribonucleotide synthase [Ignavibacteria bacterium]|nr:5-(carboxyamino)imidazole ribonucleotide synthase [Ignavibacteria bacterium]